MVEFLGTECLTWVFEVSVDDHLGGGLPVDGPVELVLHGGEETLGGGRAQIVVNGGGVDIGDFLVELALAQTNFADALELFFEVLLAEDRAACFQSFIVHGKALDGVFLDDRRRPFAELDGPLGVDLVADGHDGGEVVVPGIVALAVSGSYPKFRITDSSGSSLSEKIFFLVVVHRPDIHVVERSHHLLAQPDVLIRIDHFDTTFRVSEFRTFGLSDPVEPQSSQMDVAELFWLLLVGLKLRNTRKARK